jgi:HD-GYP domain-containing protein (c-di-GMP phosphodiesterase class II)
MRKKIRVDDLAIGMYVAELCGAWMDNPFWSSSFAITDQKQINTLRSSKIREVWIDLHQSPDTLQKTATPAVAHLGATQPPLTGDSNHHQIAPVPIADELAQAAKICAQARVAVTSMFREARMGNTVDAVGVNQLVQDISDSVKRNGSALISLARLKTADDYTYMHSVAVCAMMIALGRQLGLNESDIRAAGIAGLLHDIGKALLPMAVLNKPGKLTPAEFDIVKTHPELGLQLMGEAGKSNPMALEVCLQHHEKVDGSGYPRGLKGAEISLYAKMGAVCDVYDAITSNRPYKAGWDPAESMRQMGLWAESHFDAAVFQAFARSLGIYPVGSLVRLTSGRIGVVIEQSPNALTMPVVKVFYSDKTKQRIPPENLNLAAPGGTDRISAREDPAKWNFPDLNVLWSGLPAAG